MVKSKIDMKTATDYQAQYDFYWGSGDRVGESSGDMDSTAEQIISTCGVGRILDIGSGEGLLVKSLMRRGVDAHGIDVSEVVTERCNKRMPGRFTHGSVLALPFAEASFQTVVSTDCMEHLAPEDVPKALKEIYRVASRYVFLKLATTQDRDGHWHLTVQGRAWWEAKCFEAGFRKHPAYYRINPYESLNIEGWQIVILLEKIPAPALLQYSLDSLREERDLHMDMLRESGSRSDAHIARYHHAIKFIRPGDAVLDAACGLGYGIHVVGSLTKARSFLGIDGSDYAVDYARQNFSSVNTTFHQGLLPDCLATIPDNSIDHVLCFETLEHVSDPVRLLAEFQRILTPGGRLTCSVPNDWSDETGIDPNPFHLHVYNKSRFVDELTQFFDIEHLVAQTADRVKQLGEACVWVARPRTLVDITQSQVDVEAEWLLAVVAKTPLAGRQVPYSERVFSLGEQQAAGHALAFARDYSNPWLIRALVSIGIRTENVVLRSRWANAVLDDPTAGAADRGAALCVLAYAGLAEVSDSPTAALLDRIEKYLAETTKDPNPSVLRWRVSLMYVSGLLSMSNGRLEAAHRFFSGVVGAPVVEYSATLLTKPAEAAYLLGLLLVAVGREAEAHRVWWEAFEKISAGLGDRLTRGCQTMPPLFEVREIAAALSLCSRLVAAAAHCAQQLGSPTVFYDECHADSVFQMRALVASEAALSNLRRDISAHQVGLNEVVRGKDWLESQWKASEAERSRLQESLASLQTGKDWLESQWKAQAAELDVRLKRIAIQQSQIHIYREKVARLKKSRFFVVARKFGFFKNF